MGIAHLVDEFRVSAFRWCCGDQLEKTSLFWLCLRILLFFPLFLLVGDFFFKCQYEKMLQGYQILVLVACFPRQCGFCFLLFAVVSEDMIVLNIVVALGLEHTPMHGTTYHKNLHIFL